MEEKDHNLEDERSHPGAKEGDDLDWDAELARQKEEGHQWVELETERKMREESIEK